MFDQSFIIYLGIFATCQSLDHNNEALLTCKDLNYPRGMALCHLGFGRLEAKRGVRSQAIIQYQQALAILQTNPLPSLELEILMALLPHLLCQGDIQAAFIILFRLFSKIGHQSLSPFLMLRLAGQYIHQLRRQIFSTVLEQRGPDW